MKKLLVPILAMLPALAFGVGQGWSDGTAVGNQTLGSTVGNVTMTNANALGSFGSYNQPSTLTNLQNTYGASNTNNVGLFSYGQGKLTNCAGYTPNPNNPASNNECDVVNLLATNPEQHAISASGITKNDPMFTNQNNAYNLGMSSPNQPSNLGSGTTQSSLVGGIGCVQTAITNPSTTTTSTCTKTGTPYPQQCTSYVTVSVVQPPPIAATAAPSCPMATLAAIGMGTQPVACYEGGGFTCPTGTVPLTTYAGCCFPVVSICEPTGACPPGAQCGAAGQAAIRVISNPYEPPCGGRYPCSFNALRATTAYTCPSGYTLSGTTCIPPATISSSTVNNCGTLQTQTAIPSGTPAVGVNGTYQCDAGYSLGGNYCNLVTPNVTSAALINGAYSCPSGKTLVGGLCY